MLIESGDLNHTPLIGVNCTSWAAFGRGNAACKDPDFPGALWGGLSLGGLNDVDIRGGENAFEMLAAEWCWASALLFTSSFM